MACFKLEQELRPCKVGDKNALFHKWSDVSEIVAPSIMQGGHGGGVVQTTLGIVEFEDGKVATVYPEEIQFVDNRTNEYYFSEND